MHANTNSDNSCFPFAFWRICTHTTDANTNIFKLQVGIRTQIHSTHVLQNWQLWTVATVRGMFLCLLNSTQHSVKSERNKTLCVTASEEQCRWNSLHTFDVWNKHLVYFSCTCAVGVLGLHAYICSPPNPHGVGWWWLNLRNGYHSKHDGHRCMNKYELALRQYWASMNDLGFGKLCTVWRL